MSVGKFLMDDTFRSHPGSSVTHSSDASDLDIFAFGLASELPIQYFYHMPATTQGKLP